MLKVDNLTIIGPAAAEIVDFSLEVKRGEIVVLIGPNNSGKSAILRTLAGLSSNVHGTIKINNINVLKEREKAKTQLGYLPNPVVLEPYLTGFEILEMVGAMHNIAPAVRSRRILALAEYFDCKSYLYTLLENLGRAFWQKIALIASLIHEPTILLWDEPIIHLDPLSQELVSESIKHSAKANTAVIVATNNLDFAQKISHRLILLNNGEVLAEGNLKQLCNQFKVEGNQLSAVYKTAYNAR